MKSYPSFLIALLLAVLAVSQSAGAEAPRKPLEIGFATSLWSDRMQEDRPLQVFLPDTYLKSNRRYAVLYLLDGDSNFLHAAAAVQFLASVGRIPELIVVAVPNTYRHRDLLPIDAELSERERADEGSRFLQFLSRELAPWVESNFRTEPYRILAGHSRGGLFAIHTLLNHPTAFNAFIAISPALGHVPDTYLDPGDRLARIPGQRFLYVSACDEFTGIAEPVRKLAGLLGKLNPPALRWKYHYYENDDHFSTRHRGLYDGLEALFSEMQVPKGVVLRDGIAGLDARYASLKEKFGFPIPLSLGTLNWAGDFLLIEHRRPEQALAFFERGAALYPQDPVPYSRVAAALKAMGKHQEAYQVLETAYKRAVTRMEP